LGCWVGRPEGSERSDGCLDGAVEMLMPQPRRASRVIYSTLPPNGDLVRLDAEQHGSARVGDLSSVVTLTRLAESPHSEVGKIDDVRPSRSLSTITGWCCKTAAWREGSITGGLSGIADACVTQRISVSPSYSAPPPSQGSAPRDGPGTASQL
jgi:hypothetical protein